MGYVPHRREVKTLSALGELRSVGLFFGFFHLGIGKQMRSVISSRPAGFFMGVVSLFVAAISLNAQVVSLTLGLDVNSPYGLSEPWFTLRNGLLRCEEIESVAERPDVKAGTGEVTTKGGKLPDLGRLEQAIKDCGAGARLRSVEATVEGELVARGNQRVLKLPMGELALKPLSKAVEGATRSKEPAVAELEAYERLMKHATAEKRVRVIGPLRMETSNQKFFLEVRTFSPTAATLRN
jgi:hypothetical protein